MVENVPEYRDSPYGHNKELDIKYIETPPQWQVYIQPKCIWSQKVLKLLEEHKEPEIIIHDIINKNMVFSVIKEGYRTTPVIFRNGTFFGGYADLHRYYQSTLINPADAAYK